MLSLSWEPDLATANPGAAAYKSALDALRIRGMAGALQRFPRPRGFVAPEPALTRALRDWAGGPGGAPVTLMVHGFDFDPRARNAASDPGDDPYRSVFAPPSTANPARLSWLPIAGVCDDDGAPGTGAAIAFAWLSKGNLVQWAGAGWNNMYLFPAFDLAPLAAQALAAVIAALQEIGRPFSILAHSLGTRVVSQAIGYLRASARPWTEGGLRRIVLLDGAEYVVDANRTLLGDGLDFDVVNLVNRQDRVLGWLAGAGSHPVRWNGSDASRVIGYAGLRKSARWLDVQFDRSDVQEWIATHLGIHMTGTAPDSDNVFHPLATWNHWIGYMDGVGSADGGNRAVLRWLLGAHRPLDWFDQSGFPVLAGGRLVDVPYYGRFNPDIPPTPMTVAERQAQQETPALSS